MPRHKRLGRFLFVGAACYLIQLLLFEALLASNVHVFWAGYIAFGLSAQVNFVLSKYVTWRDRPSRWDQLIRYNMTAVLLAGINTCLVLAFAHVVWNWLAIALAIAITTIGSFTMSHSFIFRGQHEPVRSHAA